jgi:hypothetical protein
VISGAVNGGISGSVDGVISGAGGGGTTTVACVTEEDDTLFTVDAEVDSGVRFFFTQSTGCTNNMAQHRYTSSSNVRVRTPIKRYILFYDPTY